MGQGSRVPGCVHWTFMAPWQLLLRQSHLIPWANVHRRHRCAQVPGTWTLPEVHTDTHRERRTHPKGTWEQWQCSVASVKGGCPIGKASLVHLIKLRYRGCAAATGMTHPQLGRAQACACCSGARLFILESLGGRTCGPQLRSRGLREKGVSAEGPQSPATWQPQKVAFEDPTRIDPCLPVPQCPHQLGALWVSVSP